MPITNQFNLRTITYDGFLIDTGVVTSATGLLVSVAPFV